MAIQLRFSTVVSLLVLVLIPCASSGCKDGGQRFRQILRSAASDMGGGRAPHEARSKSAHGKKQVLSKNKDSITKCPEGSKLYGAGPPRGFEQYCANAVKGQKPLYNGPLRSWHKNESLRLSANYKLGQYHGKYKEWHRNGIPKIEARFFEGARHGKRIQWGKDGRKKIESTYHLDQLHGTFIKYRRKGTIEQQGTYIKGQQDGLWRTFHRNGNIKSEETWRNGRRDGVTKTYSRNGTLVKQGTFLSNVQHGLWYEFWKDGAQRRVGYYKEGQKHGKWLEYKRKGTLIKTTWYDSGVITRNESPAKARAAKARIKQGSFGGGDILGAEPPLPQVAPVVKPRNEPQRNKSTLEPEGRGNWKKL